MFEAREETSKMSGLRKDARTEREGRSIRLVDPEGPFFPAADIAGPRVQSRFAALLLRIVMTNVEWLL
jgi:hypothetical protein